MCSVKKREEEVEVEQPTTSSKKVVHFKIVEKESTEKKVEMFMGTSIPYWMWEFTD